MIVKFLDKFGKLVKSITSIAYIPVDVEPVENSKHLLSSGAGANISSNIAPNYTEKTYEANSYVMQGGVLYTNPNAIETAEDWNPTHWTQTTVAEMVAGAGGGGSTGYNQKYKMPSTDADGNYIVTEVKNRDAILANATGASTKPWKISIDDDCTDAFVILKIYGGSIRPSSIEIRRSNGPALVKYGVKGQMVSAEVSDGDCGFDVTPYFNGIGRDPSSEVIIRICGDMALLSFTVA